jgi:methylase of polypeptide subunit release factors
VSRKLGAPRRFLRNSIHFLSYHLFMRRRRDAFSRAGGFELTVPPTVFHPGIYAASEFFVSFIETLAVKEKRVAEIGTGSGILALAAARSGAASVIALDINPHAARAASDNAVANGQGERVRGVCSDLFSAIAPRPLFDVIISNPPFFAGEPRDLADRAWHAGPDYRDIAALFEQSRERLAPGGRMYVLLSSDSDLDLLRAMMLRAGLTSRLAAERSIVIESMLIFELQAIDG